MASDEFSTLFFSSFLLIFLCKMLLHFLIHDKFKVLFINTPFLIVMCSIIVSNVRLHAPSYSCTCGKLIFCSLSYRLYVYYDRTNTAFLTGNIRIGEKFREHFRTIRKILRIEKNSRLEFITIWENIKENRVAIRV